MVGRIKPIEIWFANATASSDTCVKWEIYDASKFTILDEKHVHTRGLFTWNYFLCTSLELLGMHVKAVVMDYYWFVTSFWCACVQAAHKGTFIYNLSKTKVAQSSHWPQYTDQAVLTEDPSGCYAILGVPCSVTTRNLFKNFHIWVSNLKTITFQGVVTTICPVLPSATAIKNFDR